MSELRDPADRPAGGTLNYTTLTTPTSSPLVRLGGLLGVAASVIGLVIFFAGCAGINQVFILSIIPVLLAVPGLVITLIGAITQKHLVSEDTHVLLALFTNACGIVGGLLEMAVWQNWALFQK